MKIIKVIVDELPKTCSDCGFAAYRSILGARRCIVLGNQYVVEGVRLKDCPLQTERTCENCKHLGYETTVPMLCSADDGMGRVELNDYCSRWEGK